MKMENRYTRNMNIEEKLKTLAELYEKLYNHALWLEKQKDTYKKYYFELVKSRNKGESARNKKLIRQNKKLKHSIHKAYTKHIKKQPTLTKVNTEGFYNVTLKPKQYFAKCDHLMGCHAGYLMDYKGSRMELNGNQFHFYARSLQEAESFLDASQIESLKFARPLDTFEKQKLTNTRSYNAN
jgi:hypothetical protein